MVIDLLQIKKCINSVIEFLAEVEDQVKLTRVDVEQITENHLTRMALIAGFRDRGLAEKALVKKTSLKSTITLAVTRENSKSNALAMEGKSDAGVRRLGRGIKAEYYGYSNRNNDDMLGNLQR